jgi:hypothetical protein
MVNFLLNFVLSGSLLRSLNSLQSIDFNHEVLLFLFFDIVLVDLLLLSKLLVSDCYDFGIHNHFIHIFNVVSVFITEVSGFLEDFLLVFALLLFLLGCRDVLLLCFSNSKHSLLLGNSSGKLFLFLLFVDSLFL